jgi:3-dehydroquinate dehydratase-1
MTKPIQIKNLTIGAGIPKICVPITAVSREAIYREGENAYAAGADLVEWRADFYEDLFQEKEVTETLKGLQKILGETPLLFTIRTKAEGGNCSVSTEDYVRLNQAAAKSGCVDLIDVEVFGAKEAKMALISSIHESGTCAIASSHDFVKTDAPETLLKRFQEMDTTGADILKMAVMPQQFEDVAAIMQTTAKMAKEFTAKPLVSMAMGSIGAISRIAGESFGSSVTFGTVGAASAPGQFPMNELQMMLKILHQKSSR